MPEISILLIFLFLASKYFCGVGTVFFNIVVCLCINYCILSAVIQRIHCGLFWWLFSHPHCLCHSLFLQVASIRAVIVITKVTEKIIRTVLCCTAAACNHKQAHMSSSYKASTSRLFGHFVSLNIFSCIYSWLSALSFAVSSGQSKAEWRFFPELGSGR